jgi:FtsZ-interacting cell division protein ZipA
MDKTKTKAKKSSVGFRLSIEAQRDLRAVSLAWDVTRQEVFERAIVMFLLAEEEAVHEGRKLLDNIEETARRLK